MHSNVFVGGAKDAILQIRYRTDRFQTLKINWQAVWKVVSRLKMRR
jgi:hypothetical protein